MMPKDFVYLAGPDVFLREAHKIRELKAKICADFGFEPVFPVVGKKTASAIFRDDCSLMTRDDIAIGLFNLTPFRGPSADPGTVFELGYMSALGRRLFGYTNTRANYIARIAALSSIHEVDGCTRDQNGYEVENNNLADNLMIVQAIHDSGGDIASVNEPVDTKHDPLAAVEAFRACLRLLRARTR
jgi:nucleoside 2-deoxyribosyltransferase